MTMMISATDETYMSHAAHESSKSNLQSKHGCIAVVNGKIMGRGHNSIRSQSQDGFIKNTCSCHAEVAALRDLWHSCGPCFHGNYSKQIKGGREKQTF